MKRMNDAELEKRATGKRLGTTLCSIGTIVCYGYMIGGMGGYLFDKGRPFVAVAGFLGGSVLAWIAMKLWRGYLVDAAELNERDKRRDEASRKS